MTSSATAVAYDDRSFVVTLADGRELRVPLSWFPVLESASADQRARVRISRFGQGLHWDELDEDLSVENLLRGQGDLTV
ncbi:DUF2442 domain-containing protein [Burkholderia sp. Bp8963]|nr:DUF2442 domain-containing protein [Burkholderia sp. Bp8963]